MRVYLGSMYMLTVEVMGYSWPGGYKMGIWNKVEQNDLRYRLTTPMYEEVTT